jgi:hypothetical protein
MAVAKEDNVTLIEKAVKALPCGLLYHEKNAWNYLSYKMV